MQRIKFDQFGGPDVLTVEDVASPRPGTGELLVRHTAVGVNYIDTYHRSGLYPLDTPSGLGLEGAGTVEAVGEGVAGYAKGDRVAYCTGPIGAYAEMHCVAADRMIRLPDAVSDEVAAASLLKGLTVQYLVRQIHQPEPGEPVLLHAAAGGVGLIATQWLKALGATVIGTVGSAPKAEVATEAGCDHVIDYSKENVAERVREITGGDGVPVVYDGVGATTWEGSLDSLRRRGLLISFGNASGPVKDVNIGVLAAKGSLFVTRPTLFDYTATAQDLEAAAADYLAVLASGDVKVNITGRYPLADAASAHEDLEARRTTGALILVP